MSTPATAPLKITSEERLELENMNLKLQLLKMNHSNLERDFQAQVRDTFQKYNVTEKEFSLDLDRGIFVSNQ